MLIIAGDIGGTKTILKLIQVVEDNLSFETKYETKYASQDFVDLVPMVEQFLDAIGNPTMVKKACFAIAGPVVNNTSQLTNLNWNLDSERLEQELGIEKIYLINDFVGVSYGVLGLKTEDLLTLQLGTLQTNSTIAVIGAGTGLGKGFLIPQSQDYLAFPTEGGHIDFAPGTDLEIQLLQYLKIKYNLPRISVERIVSGQGIVAIYQFLRDEKIELENGEIDKKIKAWEIGDKTIDPAAIIAQGALEKADRLCVKTLQVFTEAYGRETGNLALQLLPYGGIYIAGGVAAKILPFMEDGRFLSAFQSKGRMKSLMETFPIHLVLNPQVGLLGSILYALNH